MNIDENATLCVIMFVTAFYLLTQGQPGEDGEQGRVGEAGSHGAPGPQGPQGPAGERVSIYHYSEQNTGRLARFYSTYSSSYRGKLVLMAHLDSRVCLDSLDPRENKDLQDPEVLMDQE